MDDRSRRSTLAIGLLLIIAGLLFLANQLFPGLFDWVGEFTWPLIVVGVGVLLMVIGLITSEPAMAVPACIVGGIGLILYWQNNTGNWESWAYIWTLIPGFVGLGSLIAGLLEGKSEMVRSGLWLVVISIIAFAVFSSIFIPLFGGESTLLTQYWPVLLIVLGVLLLAQALLRRRA